MRRRTPMTRGRRRGDNPALRDAWRLTQDRCACCWAPVGASGVEHHVHHMLNGKYGRPDDVRALLLLCFQLADDRPRCHDLAEGHRIRCADGSVWPVLTLGMQFAFKCESDPDNFDAAWLQARLGKRPLPEIEPIADMFLLERGRWHGRHRR